MTVIFLNFENLFSGGGGNENNNNRMGRIRTNDTQREFDVNPEPQIVQQPPIHIDAKNEEQFPSLGAPSTAQSVQLSNSVRHVVYGQSGLARTQENFPALGGGGSEKSKIQPKQNNSGKQSGATASSLFKATGNKGQQQKQPQPQKSQSASNKNPTFKKDSVSDFPSLGPSSSKTSFFAEHPKTSNQNVDKRPSSSSAAVSKNAAAKKDLSNNFPTLGFTTPISKKRDLMEDLILPTSNIDKGIVASKHRDLMNDYVSVASQMTKVNLVKQKDEAARNAAENQQKAVPKLNSINNFPTLGESNDSGSKPAQWITVNSKGSNTNVSNNTQKQPQAGSNNKNNNTSISNNQKLKQQNQVPQKNQKSNGTKKAPNGEKKFESGKENQSFVEQQYMIPSIKPPPGFKQIQEINNSYTKLPDANKRNQALVEEFQKVLKSHEQMQEFRVLSQMFRDGNYFARSYYESCKGVLGEKFDSIFPELLVLLPDIEKQQVNCFY